MKTKLTATRFPIFTGASIDSDIFARAVLLCGMGLPRHTSRSIFRRRWEEGFDALQSRCRSDFYSPTIGEILDHGIPRARWVCRSCGHWSEPFALGRFGRHLKVRDFRQNYVCSTCSTGRPLLRLIADDREP